MRQMIIDTPRECGDQALYTAEQHGGVNLALIQSTSRDGARSLLMASLSNDAVEGLLLDLSALPDLHVTLLPDGVIALTPPAAHLSGAVRRVTDLSPIEIFLAGVQSVGSWRGFLGYAAAAGVVVWIGLFTNTVYLLIAAMLIAPFAGPAMNAALASARGDLHLFGRSLLRYGASLLTGIVIAWLLSLIFHQHIATRQMIAASQISLASGLLPLVAGAAGALHESQSQRTSLVSGAAVGVLVAASLAPPAGLAGMGIALLRWDLVRSALFLLVLQLAGINLSAAAIFRLYGVSPRGNRLQKGKTGVFPAVLIGAGAVFAGLILWQVSNPPHLQRSSQAERAASVITSAVNGSGLARVVSTDVHFTRATIPSQNTLLSVVYVQASRSGLSDAHLKARLTRLIVTHLRVHHFHITPLTEIVVLRPPGASR